MLLIAIEQNICRIFRFGFVYRSQAPTEEEYVTMLSCKVVEKDAGFQFPISVNCGQSNPHYRCVSGCFDWSALADTRHQYGVKG